MLQGIGINQLDLRSKYKPFFRINKSVLFLGLNWEDMLPGIVVFITSQIIFKDLLICSFIGVFFIFLSAILRRKHRSKILKDVALSLLTEEVIYVQRNRSIKFNRRK